MAAGFGRTRVDHLKQCEKGRGGVADDHKGAFEMRAPEFDGGGGAGGSSTDTDVTGRGIVQCADDIAGSCR